jgi:hypothetical protein
MRPSFTSQDSLKLLQSAEQLALFLASLYLFSLSGFAWWVYLLLWITPDVGMVGYLLNPKIGSLTYNFTHWQLGAWVLILPGLIWQLPWLLLVGTIVLGHSSLDRVLGYGLKYPDNFKHTHLS